MAPKSKLLFITNREAGAANVHLAVSYEILLHHPDVEIHFMSFPSLEKQVQAVSTQASKSLQGTPKPKPIIFHTLPGHSVTESLEKQHDMRYQEVMTTPPGVAGAIQSYRRIATFGWPGEEHLKLYAATASMIQDIHPALVVLDPVFIPGVEACRDLKIKFVMLSPNAMKDLLAQDQPKGAMLWKYPAISSGFPYPLPLHLIPVNIYLIFRFIFCFVFSKSLSTRSAYLKRHNHKAAPPFSTPADDLTVPWFFPSLPEIDLPVTVIPKNVTLCGPIIMQSAPVSDTDAELAQWLARRPTIVINLGSLYRFDRDSAASMLGAIDYLLERVGNVQVLWKMAALKGSEAWAEDMKVKLKGKGGRVRVEKWIVAEMAAVLSSDTVILAVHHGGASSYHEAIRAGIPQIILPMWVDLYDFATRVEYLGIGLWGSKNSAPNWDITELGSAMVKVVQDNEASRAMRKRAKELGEICRRDEGRKVAARKIFKMI